jgi:hypothetical protein
MLEARKIFNERKGEIDGFFDHLSSFEKQNSNQKLEQTLKASCFLLLYNLVESTLTQAITAIYDDLEEKKVEYCSIKEILKKRVVKNLVGKQDIDRLHDRFLQSGGNILVSGFNAVALFSGNVDARRVREIAQEYGFSDRINKKVKGAADDLLTIKTNRNDLAHGSKSFSEIGRDYTIEQLKEIKDSSIAYLDCILKNIENYIQEQEYLI